MTCSAAQLAANQKNSGRSTGPRSDQGKEKSRRNSLRHGLTGAGIVLPNEDVEALEAKLAAFEDDLKPTNAIEQELVTRFGLATVRLDRLARQEAKAVASRMRNAPSVFDDAKMAEVDHLISWIANEPVTNTRRLKRSPGGVSRLIAQIEGLRSDLMRQPTYRWEYQHCDQLHNYLGLRREEMPITRIRALTEAIHGKFENLDPSEIPESETLAKRRWAIRELVELIDAEIAKLKTLLETFDPNAIELDRAEAAERAMFDDSKEGILARKYEGACERTMYKALKELRALRTESAQAQSKAEVASEPAEELGSFSPADPERSDAETNMDSMTATIAPEAPKRRPDPAKLVQKGRRKGTAR